MHGRRAASPRPGTKGEAARERGPHGATFGAKETNEIRQIPGGDLDSPIDLRGKLSGATHISMKCRRFRSPGGVLFGC